MYRLIYKSRGTEPITWSTLDSIVETSLVNNLNNSIGGFLLCTETSYLQVLEGTSKHLNTTFSRIMKDPRHTDVELIAYHEIEKRMFDHWEMRTIGVFDFNNLAKTILINKYGAENGQVRFPDTEWQVLAMIYDIHHSEEIPEWNKDRKTEATP